MNGTAGVEYYEYNNFKIDSTFFLVPIIPKVKETILYIILH